MKTIIGLVWIVAMLVNSGCVAPGSNEAKTTPSASKKTTKVQHSAPPQRKSKPTSTITQINKSMGPVDQLKRNQALENANDDQPTNWANPISGNQYTITPNRTFQKGDIQCRDYQIAAVIQGRQYTAQTTGCRDLVGHWQ